MSLSSFNKEEVPRRKEFVSHVVNDALTKEGCIPRDRPGHIGLFNFGLSGYVIVGMCSNHSVFTLPARIRTNSSKYFSRSESYFLGPLKESIVKQTLTRS